MHQRPAIPEPRRIRRLPALAAALVVTACGGGGTGSGPAPDGVAMATSARTGADGNANTASASTEGRLLASNCFQCHGTGGSGGFDDIRGSEANEVLEFLTDNPSSNIMAAHAQGYTPAQLQKIIAYLQQQ